MKKKNIKKQAPEPRASYRPVKLLPRVIDFPYKKFARIAAEVPFSQREWAQILHLSEKTLQRYARDNRNFEGIYVDRILQMEELIQMGLEAFTTPQDFYNWLKRDKPVLGNTLNFDALQSGQGIQLTINEVGRILHGIYI